MLLSKNKLDENVTRDSFQKLKPDIITRLHSSLADKNTYFTLENAIAAVESELQSLEAQLLNLSKNKPLTLAEFIIVLRDI